MRREDELIRGKQSLHCVNCDKPTFLTSVKLQAPMCSLDCEDTFAGGYDEAQAKKREASEWQKRYC